MMKTPEEIKQALRDIKEFCKGQEYCLKCPLKWGENNCFMEDDDWEKRYPDRWMLEWSDE